MTFVNSELTCISVGGPATTVSWARVSTDSTNILLSDNSRVTVLNDKNTANYTHTLSITGEIEPGNYECLVSNNKPSSSKAGAMITNGMLINVL